MVRPPLRYVGLDVHKVWTQVARHLPDGSALRGRAVRAARDKERLARAQRDYERLVKEREENPRRPQAT